MKSCRHTLLMSWRLLQLILQVDSGNFLIIQLIIEIEYEIDIYVPSNWVKMRVCEDLIKIQFITVKEYFCV